MRSVRHGERGITLPLVAIAIVVLMGAASLALDIGNGWLTRRDLIIATDSAALAAAQEYASGDLATFEDCSSIASTYMTKNGGAASFSCTPYDGFVTVTATDDVQTWFASVIGRGDYTVNSTTSAAWGPPEAVTGLRPIGLCYEGSAALQAIVNSPPAPGTSVMLTIDYDKDQPNACGAGATPGNWGVLDFDGGGNTFKDLILYGYEGEVYVSDHAVSSCSSEAHCYGPDPGALAGVQGELNTLQSSGIFFTLPVFNFVEGNGKNARYHLMGVLRVRLVSYKVNGNPNGRYFEFEVEPGLITGTIGGSGSGANNNSVIAICGVDPGDVSAC